MKTLNSYFNSNFASKLILILVHKIEPKKGFEVDVLCYSPLLSLDALCLRQYMLGDMVYPYCRRYVTKVADKVHG